MKYSIEDIKKRVDEIYDSVVSFRRDIHENPELSEHEVRTSAKIAEKLTALGINYQSNIAGHGISALIEGKNKEYNGNN